MYNLYKNIQGFTPVKIIIKYKLERRFTYFKSPNEVMTKKGNSHF